MTEEEADKAAQIIRERYDLDKPVMVQFFLWVKGMVTEGKFGYSFSYRKDVGELIVERMPKTLALAMMAHAHLYCRWDWIGVYLWRHANTVFGITWDP